MSNENIGWVQALLDERRGYAANLDKKDRLAAVDAELAKFGVAVGKDGDVTLPTELVPEPEEVDAGLVETLETTDGAPAKKPAVKPKK